MGEARELTGYPSIDKPWLKYYSEEVINTEILSKTLTEYIEYKNKDQTLPALEFYGRIITYREFFDNVYKISSLLTEHDVQPFDNVTFALPLIPETIYLIYALDVIGAAANLVDPRVPSERMQEP